MSKKTLGDTLTRRGTCRRLPAGVVLAAPILALLVLNACGSKQEEAPSTVITNATLIDGTGAPARTAAVRIVGDRIVEIGDIEASFRDSLVDAGGLVLAPGFIDTHSHADGGLFEHPDALAVVSQGITTVIVGQDGGSPLPLADFFEQVEQAPAAVTVASYVGFGPIRERVMGEDFKRPATDDEIEKMRAFVRDEMEAGALGLGTGLEYDPGIYSSPEEVIALAREAASFGGRYISHVRSEDRWFDEYFLQKIIF